MATINITIQSLLNSSSYDLQIVDTAGTIGDLKTAMETNFSYSAVWFELVFNDEVLDTAETIGSYGIVDGSVLKIQNNIANLATKPARQIAKLELAQLRRQAGGDTSATFYRSNNIYDIDLLADKYISPTSTVGTTSTLVEARPWIQDQVYLFDQISDELKPFTYGQASIGFTLKANGTFVNITCPYGAGGYSASSGQLTMLGTKLIGGTSPANDILWNYVCAANDGVITSFTYASGTPP